MRRIVSTQEAARIAAKLMDYALRTPGMIVIDREAVLHYEVEALERERKECAA